MGICLYEASKKVLPYADVVSASYAFLFIPAIRKCLLQWMGIGIRGATVIVDEAHNLPQYLREIQTYAVTSRALVLSMTETQNNGDPNLGSGIYASDVVNAVRAIMDDAAEKFLKRGNDMIPPDYLAEGLMTRFGKSSTRNIVVVLHEAGMAIAERKRSRRKLSRSHLAVLAQFILDWLDCDDSSYVFLISGDDALLWKHTVLTPRTPPNLCVCVEHRLACRAS